MNTRRLLHWGDLEESRRRQARRGLAGLPPWLYALAAGLLAAVEVARRAGALGAAAAGDASLEGAGKLLLLGVAAGQILVVFGAPFRLFWRHDAALISRLAIPGRAMFAVGLVRSARAAGRVLLASAVAALAFALGPEGVAMALRHLAVAAVAALMAGLLAPALVLLAGGMVASDKVQAALDSMGGEFHAPRTSWLGVLPGVNAAALGLMVMGAAAWARGAAATTMVGPPAILLGAGAAVSIAAALWALARAGAVMPAAMHEVVALDQERLAHVDLVAPSRMERLVARMLGDGAGAVLDKDARLLRRRYPIPFFAGAVGLIALVILGAVQPADVLVWAAAVAAGVGAYGVVMARRSVSPPTEHVRFLATLPAGRGMLRAKRARVALWVVAYLLPGAAVVVWRAPAAGAAALALGLIAAASIALGWIAIRR